MVLRIEVCYRASSWRVEAITILVGWRIQALALIDISGRSSTEKKTGNPRSRFPKLHDAAQEVVMLAQLMPLKIYARAARVSSIVTVAGGCGDLHSTDCAAPERTYVTSAIAYHSR